MRCLANVAGPAMKTLDPKELTARGGRFVLRRCFHHGGLLFAVAAMLAVFVVLSPAPAMSAEKFKLAVNDLNAFGVPESLAQSISDLFRTELFKTGYFHVMERGQMNRILEEQSFQLTGATESDIVEIGKLLAVQLMVMGSINQIGSKYIVNVRLVDVQEGRVKWAESVEAVSQENITPAIGRLANKIAKSIPLRGKIIGERAGEIIVSLGSQDNVEPGMTLRVQRLGESFRDPETKKVLGRTVIEVALLRIGQIMGESLSTAFIVEEYASIEIGDIVGIWTGAGNGGQVTPAPAPSPRREAAPKKAAKAAPKKAKAPKPSKALPTLRQLEQQLKSDDDGQIRAAARVMNKNMKRYSGLLPTVNAVLITRYVSAKSKTAIDAMSWLCNVLGASGDASYRTTLTAVAKNTPNRKLKGYANKAVARLK